MNKVAQWFEDNVDFGDELVGKFSLIALGVFIGQMLQ